MAKLNMVKALNLALMQEMERDPDVLVIGEDVGVDGGVFRVTEDLHRKFGGTRVMDTPLAEAGIIGASVGMALYGLKPVCEIQFSGFAFQCFHQIENHVARYRMRSQSRFGCQMVVRMPYRGGVRALEHHEESGVEVEIVDLLTISPLDRETLAASVRKTGRAVVVHEAPRSFGPGAEIATSIMEGAFLSLEAPIRRMTASDLPFVGFARERANVPDVPRVLAACRETLAF